MNDPAELRRTYERDALSEASIAATWLEQLRLWFDDAVELGGSPEPNAMQVATVDGAGHPALRTVLAKSIDERGVTFYTNYHSAKGHDLYARPYVAAQFLWLAHERQVRLTGPVQRVSAEETETYFHTRPRGSQIGAWASPQSQVIISRAVLEQRVAEAESRYWDAEIPVPPFWGGYLLTPDSAEFWQGRPDRLHDRLRFRRDGDDWVLERLAP
ncbi:MAG TPA: pyridoxamine 5'-phosphate oxidase [Jatrophihabitans sp.]|jgi:pyridoxamine 5'-phosphate oxidase